MIEDNDDALRLVREMRREVAKLAKLAETSARRTREEAKLAKHARRIVIWLLAAAVVLMAFQTLMMMGYGPASDNNDNSQAVLKVHLAG